MKLFDILHLVLHFLVIGSYLYLLLAIINVYKKSLSMFIYRLLLVVCITMILNLLAQATKGQFIFDDLGLHPLKKLPTWLVTNGANAYVLYHFIKEGFKKNIDELVDEMTKEEKKKV